MKKVLFAALTALLLTGCDRHNRTLGSGSAGPAISIAEVAKLAEGAPVVLQGSMTEKCPVAGCWFTLQDSTGTIKVDTKTAKFVIVDVPLKAQLLVSGRIMKIGDARSIEASGIRF